MKTTFLIAFLSAGLLIVSNEIFAQIAINTDGSIPDNSAMLDVKSIEMGVLVPRMSTVERDAIANPANGLLIYNLDTASFWYFSDGAWIEISKGKQKALIDDDNDTKVEVEHIPDEDLIRFTLGGTERMIIQPARISLALSNYNTIIGENAGSDELPGTNNVALGHSAFRNDYGAVQGSNNVAVGYYALGDFESGNNNTAIGSHSLGMFMGGNNNIAIGYNSLSSSAFNSNCIAVGINALGDAMVIDDNIAIGTAAGFDTHGTKNISIGICAGWETYGEENIAIGYQAGNNNWGDRNTFIGIDAGHYNEWSQDNIALGYQTGYYISDVGNVAIGRQAGYSNSNGSGSGHVLIGNRAGYSMNQGANDCLIGFESGYYNTSGKSNVAIGQRSLYRNTNRCNLVAIGDSALCSNSLGATNGAQAIFNTAVGSKSLSSNTIGSGNTANGFKALMSNIDGNGNTALGNYALQYNTSGNYNTSIGYNSGSLPSYNYSNCLSMGYDAIATESDQVRLGNSQITSLYCQGAWQGSVGTTTRALFVDEEGKIGYVSSSARYKDNIEDLKSTDWLYKLRPVIFTYKADLNKIKHFGLIAEEVEKVSPGMISYNKQGEPESVTYTSLITPMLKAIQEQQQTIVAQQKQIDQLKNIIEKLVVEQEFPGN